MILPRRLLHGHLGNDLAVRCGVLPALPGLTITCHNSSNSTAVVRFARPPARTGSLYYAAPFLEYSTVFSHWNHYAKIVSCSLFGVAVDVVGKYRFAAIIVEVANPVGRCLDTDAERSVDTRLAGFTATVTSVDGYSLCGIHILPSLRQMDTNLVGFTVHHHFVRPKSGPTAELKVGPKCIQPRQSYESVRKSLCRLGILYTRHSGHQTCPSPRFFPFVCGKKRKVGSRETKQFLWCCKNNTMSGVCHAGIGATKRFCVTVDA